MPITPLDIRKQPFRRAFRGFDPDEVSAFLNQVAIDFEASISRSNDMANRIKVLEQQLADYQKIEKNLNDTLLTAQRATDEARVNAQKEAELIIKDAQIRADRYEEEARRRVYELENEQRTLRAQRDSFLTRFTSVLKNQLELVQSIAGDLKEPDNRIAGGDEDTMDEVLPQPDMSSTDIVV